MADSFFGFNTTLPDDDGGGPLESFDEEALYDALNDQTFGTAQEGDWENLHENLVKKLDGESGVEKNGSTLDDDSDLELNFAKFNLDDFDFSLDDDTKVQLDPSVWASKPMRPVEQQQQQLFPSAPRDQQQQQQQPSIDIFAQLLMKQVPPPATIKMCTVEELERNMLSQSKGKKTETTPEKKVTLPPPRMPPMGLAPPPGMQPLYGQQMHLPPGHLMNQPQIPMVGMGAFNPLLMQRARSMPYPFPPGSMPPMNNFGMAPPFHRGPPPRPPQQMPLQQPPLPTNVNQFNQRLVEEIQQNHPMLSYIRPQHHFNNGHRPPQQLQQQQQQQQQLNRQHQSNGNYKAEPQDPYANLMSNRDKQWLISIQLMQLNTDTPYYDDFYFTVYKERKAKCESRAYTSNTLNHPFTQGPKGHAHNMLLVSLTNKNGMNHNNKNGPFNRERKNSETTENKEQQQQQGRHYTPLQFENSLGKLQCGSVTAPRKIIDMEVVATDSGHSTSAELTVLRKTTRQILLHIETLFKVVLKLEDLENPIAIAAAQIISQKRAKEIQQALDQAAIARALAGETGDTLDLKISVPTDKYPDPETYDELMPKLLAGLTPDKVTAMMAVRKGRQLLSRSMPFLKKNPHRWDIWCGIIASLYLVFKKEKEIDSIMMKLYEEFCRQLCDAKLCHVVQIAQSLVADKKTNALLSQKYTLSIIVALILHAETLFCNADYKRTTKDEEIWQQFLKTLSNAADGIKVHANGPAIGPMDNQVLTTMIQHLTRFNSVVQPKPLLNLLTQADSK